MFLNKTTHINLKRSILLQKEEDEMKLPGFTTNKRQSSVLQQNSKKSIRNAVFYYNPECTDTSSKTFHAGSNERLYKQERNISQQETRKLCNLTAVEISHFMLKAVRNTSLQPVKPLTWLYAFALTTNTSSVTNCV